MKTLPQNHHPENTFPGMTRRNFRGLLTARLQNYTSPQNLSPPQRLLLYCAEIREREKLKRAGDDGKGEKEKGSSRLLLLLITPRAPPFSLREPLWRREPQNNTQGPDPSHITTQTHMSYLLRSCSSATVFSSEFLSCVTVARRCCKSVLSASSLLS